MLPSFHLLDIGVGIRGRKGNVTLMDLPAELLEGILASEGPCANVPNHEWARVLQSRWGKNVQTSEYKEFCAFYGDARRLYNANTHRELMAMLGEEEHTEDGRVVVYNPLANPNRTVELENLWQLWKYHAWTIKKALDMSGRTGRPRRPWHFMHAVSQLNVGLHPSNIYKQERPTDWPVVDAKVLKAYTFYALRWVEYEIETLNVDNGPFQWYYGGDRWGSRGLLSNFLVALRLIQMLPQGLGRDKRDLDRFVGNVLEKMSRDTPQDMGNVSLWSAVLHRVQPDTQFASRMFGFDDGNVLAFDEVIIYELMQEPARSNAEVFNIALQKCGENAAHAQVVREHYQHRSTSQP